MPSRQRPMAFPPIQRQTAEIQKRMAAQKHWAAPRHQRPRKAAAPRIPTRVHSTKSRQTLAWWAAESACTVGGWLSPFAKHFAGSYSHSGTSAPCSAFVSVHVANKPPPVRFVLPGTPGHDLRLGSHQHLQLNWAHHAQAHSTTGAIADGPVHPYPC